MMHRPLRSLGVLLGLLALSGLAGPADQAAGARQIEDGRRYNVVFILVDDLRYDAMGFMGHPFLQTPHIDSLAQGGIHFRNALVTTSLCSPSRASILTGQYMHNHRVVDNNDLAPPGTIFFPQYLQEAGYQTAFVGKWHMGGSSDDPRPGFDHWVSFRGQGHYVSPGPRWSLNVGGQRVPQRGYITDELTDYALDWLADRNKDQPFFLYLSHKAVHAEFRPADRHKDFYSDVEVPEPSTQADTEENYRGKPMWVKNQRNSWHGVDFPYHSSLDIKEYYRNYCRTLLAVDDSVGRVMAFLEENDLVDDTVVMFMGDNGFLFGEHGLIDKRNAYEESILVPLIAHCPSLFMRGDTVDGVVANIDIGPTILELAGLETPEHMDGESFVKLATGGLPPDQWRDYLLYEYYWEWNFPHTPTMFALRGDRFKFIQHHGIWDTDELYDLQADPQETRNLIREPEYQDVVRDLRGQLNQELQRRGAMQIPFGAKRGPGAHLRRAGGSQAAEFPEHVLRETD